MAAKDAAVTAESLSSSNPSKGIATSGPTSSSEGPQSTNGASGLGSSSSSKMKKRRSSELLPIVVAAANNIRQTNPASLFSTSVVPMRMNGQIS